jgi:hypothetical protein
MSRFLVEVDHDAEATACVRAVRVFHSSGSHFLTHAMWGCLDGVHSAWIIVDAESHDEARWVVPPAFRARSRVVCLCEFTVEQMEGLVAHHQHS